MAFVSGASGSSFSNKENCCDKVSDKTILPHRITIAAFQTNRPIPLKSAPDLPLTNKDFIMDLQPG